MGGPSDVLVHVAMWRCCAGIVSHVPRCFGKYAIGVRVRVISSHLSDEKASS